MTDIANAAGTSRPQDVLYGLARVTDEQVEALRVLLDSDVVVTRLSRSVTDLVRYAGDQQTRAAAAEQATVHLVRSRDQARDIAAMLEAELAQLQQARTRTVASSAELAIIADATLLSGAIEFRDAAGELIADAVGLSRQPGRGLHETRFIASRPDDDAAADAASGPVTTADALAALDPGAPVTVGEWPQPLPDVMPPPLPASVPFGGQSPVRPAPDTEHVHPATLDLLYRAAALLAQAVDGDTLTVPLAPPYTPVALPDQPFWQNLHEVLAGGEGRRRATVDRAALVAELRRQAASPVIDDGITWQQAFTNLAAALDGSVWLA